MDPSIPSSQKVYRIKGYTNQFSTDTVAAAFENRLRLSRDELIRNDVYGLIKTFEKCLDMTKMFKMDHAIQYRKWCEQITEDLKVTTLNYVITKWQKILDEE